MNGMIIMRIPKDKQPDEPTDKPGEDWYTSLQDSAIYMPVVTAKFFNDAKAYSQWQMARELKKPFLILLEHGVKIPKEYLEDIGTVLIERWKRDRSRDTVKAASLKLLQRYGIVKP